MPTYSSDRTSSAMLNLQKEVLNVYEQANRAWFARVKSEVNLWSALARKLSATRYTPEALDTYQKFMVERVQMAAEDGRQLLHDCQESTQKLTRSLSSGWLTSSNWSTEVKESDSEQRK
jgi:hypothetical protein